MSKIFVGIDNGVSGGIAISRPEDPMLVFSTPVKEVFGYQKVAKKFNRLDHERFKERLEYFLAGSLGDQIHIVIERPMVMPARFEATVSALRCYEATLVCLEQVLPQAAVETVDSRAWQKIMLPEGLRGPELKKASMQRGVELFPGCADWIRKQKDADPLMICEWARRTRG